MSEDPMVVRRGPWPAPPLCWRSVPPALSRWSRAGPSKNHNSTRVLLGSFEALRAGHGGAPLSSGREDEAGSGAPCARGTLGRDRAALVWSSKPGVLNYNRADWHISRVWVGMEAFG